MKAALRVIARHRWLPALVWTGLILSVSSLPDLSVEPPLFPGCDKVAHLIVYFILGVTLRFWTAGRTSCNAPEPRSEACEPRAGDRHGRPGDARSRLGMWVILGGFAFGAMDEVHQRFIPGREMSLGDFLADAVGFALGYGLGKRLVCRHRGSSSSRAGGADGGPATNVTAQGPRKGR